MHWNQLANVFGEQYKKLCVDTSFNFQDVYEMDGEEGGSAPTKVPDTPEERERKAQLALAKAWKFLLNR